MELHFAQDVNRTSSSEDMECNFGANNDDNKERKYTDKEENSSRSEKRI